MSIWNYRKRERELIDEREKLQREINIYREKYELELKEGRPNLVIKLGDRESGWIPNSHHFSIVRKFVKDSGLDKKYNVLIFHYAIEVEII